ncbi:mavicyanin-like [Lolium rigidum]|uniref:mavicyanin-like n=1 Tax=Lolium rigidum TaxID=89674 RepID=UPI001F5D837C|nr:mavicyanin-like [Lolium rigidum]
MGGARSGSALAVAAAVAVVMWAGTAAAAVYEVGDKLGWTIMNNPDYASWAKSKKFSVGDTIVFTYNKQFHNVIAVSKADYKNCDVTKPTATWSTGKDSVVLNTTGHHYFLCGFPGHCAIGQKVDVPVLSSAAPSTAPSMAPTPSAAGGGSAGRAAAAAPSPHGNAASTVGCSFALTIAASVLSVAAASLNLL